MHKQRILHLSAKLMFVGASAGLLLAFLELALNMLGFSLLGHAYSSGRIIELSSALLIYVLTVLVWEVLRELTAR